ncbi:MAG: hypothetical protein QMC77_07150 [Methanocellales archaeon]|nr:hypothetical protein [Methanocellales archaeon]
MRFKTLVVSRGDEILAVFVAGLHSRISEDIRGLDEKIEALPERRKMKKRIFAQERYVFI